MDQNQNNSMNKLQSPADEQPKTYQRPSSSTIVQRQIIAGQYYKYIPVLEAKPQIQQQIQMQQDPERDIQQQIQQLLNPPPSPAPITSPASAQARHIIQYEYCEPPMTLNAWTQTTFSDNPSRAEAALLAKIHELEAVTRTQADEIERLINGRNNGRSPSPMDVTSNSSMIKHERTTYRILTQENEEATSEAQIEIEISNDVEVPSNSSSNVYTLRASASPESNRINDRRSSENGPNASNKPKAPVKARSPRIKLEYSEKGTENDVMVVIGPNGTKVPSSVYESIAWDSASIATRKLLTTIFSRETLATHSMTGKASPAFKDLNKPVKARLEPNAVQDIIHCVSTKCGVSTKEVRSSITTKCADENKMIKIKKFTRPALNDMNHTDDEDKENAP